MNHAKRQTRNRKKLATSREMAYSTLGEVSGEAGLHARDAIAALLRAEDAISRELGHAPTAARRREAEMG